jgi:hypothetical protein
MRQALHRIALILASVVLSAAAQTQAQEASWIRTYGGGYGHGVEATPDGGALLAGTFGVLGDCCHPWLLKLDAAGGVEWHTIYDAPGLGGANDLAPAVDGGYVMAGDGVDLQVLKVDADGDVGWARSYGDGGYTHGRVLPTPDGHYLLTGATGLLDNGFYPNGRALKLDRNGDVLWQKVYGQFGSPEYLTRATLAYNGNYILAGMARGDYWVLEVDRDTGRVVWQNTYGGWNEDTGLVVAQVLDEYYLVAGASDSYTSGGLRNWWVVVLDKSGKVVRQVTLGGIDAEDPHAVLATSDGGFILGGGTGSFGVGFSDVWLVKFDRRMRIEWQKAYGTAGRTEHAWQIQELPEGYAVIGDSYLFPEAYDIWLMTLDRDGNVLQGGCGTVTSTRAGLARTNTKGFPSFDLAIDTDVRPNDLRVTAESQDWSAEVCSPGPERD